MNDLSNTLVFLFVYGTLMRGFSNRFAQKIAKNAIWIGKGTFTGHLFDLGFYPGAVYDPNTTSQVHGEVWQLADFERIIKALDTYEGVDDKTPEYVRREVPVLLENGCEMRCWAYIFCQPTENYEVIMEGDYRKRKYVLKQQL
ncbi:MAG: gamma-glutamylcyclotransferase family protein [Spirosomataceae bacterium]